MTVDHPLKSRLIATKKPMSANEVPGQGSHMKAPKRTEITPLIQIQAQPNIGFNSKAKAIWTTPCMARRMASKSPTNTSPSPGLAHNARPMSK